MYSNNKALTDVIRKKDIKDVIILSRNVSILIEKINYEIDISKEVINKDANLEFFKEATYKDIDVVWQICSARLVELFHLVPTKRNLQLEES